MAGRRKPRVAVVFGGRSSEHAISCVSAGSVLAAIDRDRYDVVPVGIARDGRWVLAADDPGRLAITDGRLPEVDPAGTGLALPGDPTVGGLVTFEPAEVPRRLGDVDVVFPLLHGPWGEDGTIQGLFELAGIPYVGSGVLASAAAMDKDVMKTLLQARGLPVGRWSVVRRGETPGPAVAALGLPVFVKPARGGSSIGISRVAAADDLPAALATAHDHDPKAVVEAAMGGREIECGVVTGAGGGSPEASVPAEVEVLGDREFYDFEAKYLDDAARLTVPANLPRDVVAEVQRLAVAAYTALGCEGLARVDFFVDAAGRATVNEVNTMPGFTPTSMFPAMWAASGLDYPALVDRLLGDALGRGAGLR